ncbi:MAG: PAS domain S-box protein [candidate division WOR-3 bacterium]|nr:MAG: PAS domain S-box protein [candidate division WOR-3 bacterium]
MKPSTRQTTSNSTVSSKGMYKGMDEIVRCPDNIRRFLDILTAMIVWLDKKGRVVLINKYACKILGYKEKDTIGKDWFDCFLPANARDEARKIFGSLIQGRTNTAKYTEYNVITKTGAERTVSWHSAAFKDESGQIAGTFNCGTDVTKRRRIENDQADSKKNSIVPVESSTGAFFLTDIKGNFKYVNRNFADLFGYTLAEMKSKSLKQLVHPDDINKVTRYYLERTKDKSIPKTQEIRGVKKDGTKIWLELNVIPLEECGEVTGTRAYVRHISEYKQGDRELRALSMVDELTRLYNRKGFRVFAEQQIRIADRSGKGFFIILADLDHLNAINENLGQKYGDQALRDVANVFSQSFRKSDVIARMGDDEFAVVAVDALKSSESIIVGRMLRNISIKNSRRKKYDLAISVGAVYYDPKKTCTLDDLLGQAEQKMYAHKKIKRELTQHRRTS